MSTWLSVNKDGNKRRHGRSLMDWQRGQDHDDDGDDDVAAETFSDLITRASEVHAQKYLTLTTSPTAQNVVKSISESVNIHRPRKATVIALDTQQSNYDKTLHKIDSILNLEQSEGNSFVDDISDYDYEDDTEDEQKETTVRPAPRTRQQFGKSLNGNLRRAGKTLSKPQRKFNEELQLKETSDTIAVESDTEASSVASVIDDYNQNDSTIRRGSSSSREDSMLTTTSESDNDDVVEIDTIRRASTEKNKGMSSTVSIIENDFQIKQNLKQKPAANDNNNESDLADKYEENNNKEQSEPPPHSINQTVSDLMLSDAALFDNDDIDIVKLDEAPTSNEVNLYKTAVEPARIKPLQSLPASENEVLKEQENDNILPAHLIPLKPYVSERFDQPSKRILVNLTIATDDGSDSVYTLHVAVPTGGGTHNVEQVLTHEKKILDEDNNIDSVGSCVFEPPPRMPDCPCSCLDPSPTIFTHKDNDPVDIDSASPTTATPHAEEATILGHQHDSSDSAEVEDPSTPSSTDTNLPSIDFDNSIAATDTNSDVLGGEKLACPDVMPILILEGDCTICSRC